MRRVAWWALLSSAIAPLVLLAGYTTGAALEGHRYNPVRQTISVLAAGDNDGYWALTSTLIAVGACHLVTALGLRPAARAGRLCLAGGGLAAILLVLFPAPAKGGSLPHGWVVGVGFSLLAVWPLLAMDHRPDAPWALRPAPSKAASALMWLGALWFVIELETGGVVGIAERVVTSAQAAWPVVVVVSCLLHGSRLRSPAPARSEDAT
ncbi:Protein of unknown function [Streptomyces sp. DvalAA-14]|uniref:DUF998 domain-containing protein n=1 Tax=unclassified Streptomyces TaxID=2593676 RepID=UPI00081B4D39|nr:MULTISPECIES: DUF998 domain-containing protein [unclassified Streptomyces]MYS24106.1 DUF998 domain-containing protein [Streptomyces sp. SID4948]SCE42651.1 Protein of unknown function [Streptomyces sp. DvalAA-14]